MNLIIKACVVGRNGRGPVNVRTGDRLTVRPDGRLDKTRKGRHAVGVSLQPVPAGIERIIAVQFMHGYGRTEP